MKTSLGRPKEEGTVGQEASSPYQPARDDLIKGGRNP